LLITPLFASPTQARDQVSLQLEWMHQFQFAGYYAAVDKGFYRKSGLEVEIREGGPAVDANATMAAGGADFGICANSPLLNKDQRANGHFTSRDLFALRCDYSDAGSLRYPQDISRIG
jgi:ABC-type nitrate/sulfonate/bicarbonate transport system substrate-binding protein